MKNVHKLVCVLAGIGWLCVVRAQSQPVLLHSFAGSPADGRYPYGSLTLAGSVLYGMTSEGGAYDSGAIYKLNTDGSAFSLLYSFTGGTDGRTPWGALTLLGSTLYGMTQNGGDYDCGVVFKINSDGSGFELLHQFDYSNGAFPRGSLVSDGSALYGLTSSGGAYGEGTVFKLSTDGSDFELLHEFGDGNDGRAPYRSLALANSTLYGTTEAGGDYDSGTLFKLNTDGSGFTLLHSFAGPDGAYPRGTPIVNDGVLYGTTYAGGDNNLGTMYRINTDGSGFTTLYQFLDGTYPSDSLTLMGSTLYGMTLAGGQSGCGTIFRINADGDGFALVHSFAGGESDGGYPYATLVSDGAAFYGTTMAGGANNGGTVFALAIPEPACLSLIGLGAALFLTHRRNHRLSPSGRASRSPPAA